MEGVEERLNVDYSERTKLQIRLCVWSIGEWACSRRWTALLMPREDDLQPLDYRTPAPTAYPSPRMVPVALLLGILAGLFGAYMLFTGIRGIVWLIVEWNTDVDDFDIVAVSAFNLIGLLSCAVAARWIWFAFRHGK